MTIPWWTFRLFFFFCSGKGKGESEAAGRGGVDDFIENPRRGGGLLGGRGREVVCGAFGGGGVLNLLLGRAEIPTKIQDRCNACTNMMS